MEMLMEYRTAGGWRLKLFPSPVRPDRRIVYTFFMAFVMLSHAPWWKFFQSFVVLVRYCLTTYTVTFDPLQTIGLRFYSMVICDCIFLIDFVSVLINRYIWFVDRGELDEKSSPLKRLLWKDKAVRPRWFITIILDLVSLIPLDLILLRPRQIGYSYFANHMLPVLRIYRVSFIFNTRAVFGVSLMRDVLRLLLKFFVLAILVGHTAACVLFLVQNESEGTSLHHAKQKINFDAKKPLHWYLISLYYSFTIYTNIGFGDTYPRNDVERIISMIIAITGFSIINGYYIGTLSSLILEHNRKFSNLKWRLYIIENDMNDRRLSTEIQKKIFKFYSLSWLMRKGVSCSDDMLKRLPPSFATEAYFEIFRDAINASVVLRSCDDYSKRAFGEVMNVQLFTPGDVILKRNEVNSTMYYLRKGTIQIMSYQDDETEIMTFGAGTVFGQCALLLTLPSKSQVHAATFCEIHTLSKRDLFHVLMLHPVAKFIIRTVHKNLLLNMLADKFMISKTLEEDVPQENVLSVKTFYKDRSEMSKIGRDDICLVSRFPYLFMPDTKFLFWWQIIVAIIVVIVCFYYPHCAAFSRRFPSENTPFVYLVDLVMYFDIYLALSTAVNKENVLLSTRKAIFKHQLSNINIYLDVISAFPLRAIVPQNNRFKSVALCFHCVKAYKIPIVFSHAEYRLGPTARNVIRTMKYVLYFILGCYLMGTCYYMEACYFTYCRRDSWFLKYNRMVEYPVIVSMYFAMMVISGTGLGDITPRNIIDVLYVLGFFFPGVLLFCYLIAEYSAHISVIRESRVNFIELADGVDSFLTNNKMLLSEKIRVRNQLNLQWEYNMGYEFTTGYDVYHDTPIHLIAYMNLNTVTKGLEDMEIFKGLGEDVINAIRLDAVRRVFPPHEVVIYAGEMCRCLLILLAGYCEITYGLDDSVQRKIGPGANICTVEFFLGLTSVFHVKTLTHCVIVHVMKRNVRRALILNPVVNREFQHAILEVKRSPLMKTFREAKLINMHLTVRQPARISVYRFPYYQREGGNTELREPYLKLGLCQWIRFFMKSATVLPYGKLLKRWELSRCFFAFCSAMLFPPLPYLELEIPELTYLAWFLDGMAWIDLYFRIHVCYYNERKIIVTHPLRTASYYLKGAFALDFVFCFPFDRIMGRNSYSESGDKLASELTMNVLRMLRVGQIHRMPGTFARLAEDYLTFPSVFQVVLMWVSFTLVYINLFTSIMYLISVNYVLPENGTYSAVFRQNSIGIDFKELIEKYSFEPKPTCIYFLSVYWTGLLVTGIGLGDVPAKKPIQAVYVIILIVISYLYFNYFTILIASSLSSINLNITIYQKRMKNLINFLKSENIDPLLQKHTINHFEYVWKKTGGIQTEKVFNAFNDSLRNDVMFHLYEETLRNVEPFKNLDISYLRIVSKNLIDSYYQAGATVYKKGEIIDQLYIIHHGEVTLVGEMEDETAILWRSDIFGHTEECHVKSIALMSAVATTNVHMLTIETYDLYQLLRGSRVPLDLSGIQNQMGTVYYTRYKMRTDSEALIEYNKKFMDTSSSWMTSKSFSSTQIFTLVYLVLAFISVNLVSFHLAFLSYHVFMLAVNIPIELMYVYKVIRGFHAPYMREDGEVITEKKEIRARYVRTWEFYFDLIALIPFELLALAAPKEKRIFTATLFRMTKLLRIHDVYNYYSAKSETLNVNIVVVKLINMAMVTSILIHQAACLWFMTCCPLADCSNSKTFNKLLNEGKCSYTYLCAVYFVVMILTTTAPGDITPSTGSEMAYLLLISLVTRIYAAAFIGQMVATVQKFLYNKTTYAYMMENMKNFMSVNNVSPGTRRSILRYAKNLYVNERGHQLPELLLHAPKYLVSEIKIAAYGHHIFKNPIFKNCAFNFNRELIKLLKRQVFFPGNIIVHQGDVNGTGYFIHAGQVGYTIRTVTKAIRTRIIDRCFGLVQGFRKEAHEVTYFARSYCVVLTLKLDDWEFLADFFKNDIGTLLVLAKDYPQVIRDVQTKTDQEAKKKGRFLRCKRKNKEST